MGLKQDIVIVNQFSIPLPDGSGTRGHKPSGYILGYMARDDAAETLTPVKYNSADDFIKRYMLRDEATETSDTVPEVKRKMKRAEMYGGKSFGKNDISLSHKDLLRKSKAIQDAFESGKTVLKTVLSFNEEYLRKYDLLDDEFEHTVRGDWRGNLDQLKLRRAIMNGLDRMDYDDLEYVGVIQIDTDNVHCHLAMVDKGVGTLAKDGTQKGKISERNKLQLRRGIDMSLDRERTVQFMASNAYQDKRNVKCFVKKFTHNMMDKNGFGQFLLACLPEDESLWRYGTNRHEMRKANYIAGLFVEEVFKRGDSGYDNALRSIGQYALERKDRENLSEGEYRQLIANGRNKLVEDAVNGVYSVFKSIPKEERVVRTPTLDVMSMDYSSLYTARESDPLIEFGFKLRSYKSRLDRHKAETTKYRDAKAYYKSQPNSSVSSRVLYKFYDVEEEYNAKCMSKYQHFLKFVPNKESYEEEFDEILDYQRKYDSLKNMINDKTFSRFRSDKAAEDYGMEVYRQAGGRLWKNNKPILKRRLAKMSENILDKTQAFRDKLELEGLTMDKQGIKKEPRYDFEDVKALDMHHLVYDWAYDTHVSTRNVNNFVRMANRRYNAYNDAKNYLESTGQGAIVEYLPGVDIEYMKQYADRLSETGTLEAKRPTGSQYRRSKTVPLDTNYESNLEEMVKSVVRSL